MNLSLDHNSVEALAAKLGEKWPAILAARDQCRTHVDKLRERVQKLRPPANTSVIAFGSLAREEWTSGSDVDWTLMIDGPADMGHFDVAKSVEEMLKEEKYQEPGSTGTFGSMSSSHELVHHIGGSEDTNHNITRRVLMLLESISLSDAVTHERVIRAILARYIVGDPPATSPAKFHVPLFLFNDIVRFWRTLTVDYATKKWQRSNAEWALKNTKLRMSRKLLFAKGMLLCFLCDEEFAGKPENLEFVDVELLEYCFRLSRRSAIDLLSWGLLHFACDETARTVMRAYNNFLATLDDAKKRDHLKQLEFGNADDPIFDEQRKNSRAFHDGLETFFFDSNERLGKLTRRYGVF